MTSNQRSQHYKQAHYYAMAFGQCMEDFDAHAQGRQLFYHLDFTLLYPQCFDRAPSGTNPPLLSTKEQMSRVLSGAADYPRFQLIISGATVLEFQDMLAHTIQEIQLRFPKMPSLRQLREEAGLSSSLNVGARIDSLHKQHLELLTADGRADRVRRPIKRLLSWIDSRTIEPASDVMDMSAVQSFIRGKGKLFERYVEEHRAARLPRETQRSVQDSLFHYRVDAANVVFTWAARDNSSGDVLFVSPTGLNIAQCNDGSVALGRSHLAPLWLMNADEQSAVGAIGDIRRYFRRGVIEGEMLAEDIPPSGPDADLPTDTMERVLRYYSRTIGLVSYVSEKTRREQTLSRGDVERIEEVVADPQKIREAQEEMVEEIRDGARTIDTRIPDEDREYLSEFRFEDDPVLKRIRKQLGLSPL
ncbi:MAG TPA: hypothetical protein VFY36_04005 [Solirubrobacteraceae bacterium]|nr:hypothetical protein [Solirubrobacteraceae bacterium]